MDHRVASGIARSETVQTGDKKGMQPPMPGIVRRAPAAGVGVRRHSLFGCMAGGILAWTMMMIPRAGLQALYLSVEAALLSMVICL
jgi:hypothetical protein